jgi:hypothetical protein
MFHQKGYTFRCDAFKWVLQFEFFKEEYLVKSNQVCARMEIKISDCQPTIAKNCHKDLI